MSSLILSKARWYHERLTAMSAPEIACRIGDAVRRQTDRNAGLRLRATPRDAGPLPCMGGVRDSVVHGAVPDSLRSQWQDAADGARSGRHDMLNAVWPDLPRGELWHIDPVSGRNWLRTAYTFSIDYRHAETSTAHRDIKYAWEVNRLQYLQPVAALACHSCDRELACFCLDEIESWIDHNPPFLGINWNSGIELALRTVSILIVTSLVGEHATRAQRAKIWACLQTHGRWIARYPSRYSSANNHRAAEGLGLFALGSTCPHFAEAAVWRKEGWARLTDAAERLIHPDGVGAEQSTAYLAALLETLLTGRLIAHSIGLPIPDFYDRKLTLGAEYLRWLMDDRGEVPRIGDDDEACVIGPASHLSITASVVGCVAAMTGRADLAPPVFVPHLRHLLFGAPCAADFAATGVRSFAHGGMTVGRHRAANGDAIMLAFDHGPVGYLSIAAHGHADALSLWLHRAGQPVLVDAGTYLYHAATDDPAAGRDAFRTTGSHNTLSMGGAAASLTAGNFNWSHKANATLNSFAARADHWHAEAEQDGYVGRFGVRHRRRVSVASETGVVIEDSLTGNGAHEVTLTFLFHPDLRVSRDGSYILIRRGAEVMLTLHHTGGLVASLQNPDDDACGQYSPRFGVNIPAPRILLRGPVACGETIRTALYWSV